MTTPTLEEQKLRDILSGTLDALEELGLTADERAMVCAMAAAVSGMEAGMTPTFIGATVRGAALGTLERTIKEGCPEHSRQAAALLEADRATVPA